MKHFVYIFHTLDILNERWCGFSNIEYLLGIIAFRLFMGSGGCPCDLRISDAGQVQKLVSIPEVKQLPSLTNSFSEKFQDCIFFFFIAVRCRQQN